MALSLKREATPCWRGDPGLLPRVADGGCAFKALRPHPHAGQAGVRSFVRCKRKLSCPSQKVVCFFAVDLSHSVRT